MSGLSFPRRSFYFSESNAFLQHYVQYSESWICPSHASINYNISGKFLHLFLYFLMIYEFLCYKEEAKMELFIVLQMNFEFSWVVAPCRLEKICLYSGVTKPSLKMWGFNSPGGSKPWRLGYSTKMKVYNVEINSQQLFILLVTSLVALGIFASICAAVDLQQWVKPIKNLPCYILSVSRRAVIIQNEHKNVTFSIKQKEYSTYSRTVLILYVDETK